VSKYSDINAAVIGYGVTVNIPQRSNFLVSIFLENKAIEAKTCAV
jgi:hypothetical protein